ncbi:cytochrome B6 [Leptolyngbya sp. 'hensonii']|uniref:QcrA and Rieske domain-containing protein n=1 Tax=Leptolyngbya sp. 'hensonii' TaxID=1922337 RepID=UPI0009501964|nr:ubiquinol-cytochrome c reductase iron-sulfur subunit [Leptolyngbya sp. 'hensonii']OLP18889.1 cytochrome B6 [Leptolyngbya sp. 'hensonii']
MERREFLSWVGVGVLASSLPVAIVACNSSTTESTNSASPASSAGSSPRGDGFVVVGTIAKLDEAGFIEDKQFAGGPILVVRDPKQPETVRAVSSVCTHAGCAVSWKKDQTAFDCPCHASTFNPDGTVKRAPAKKPLKTFLAKVEGDTVLVKA